MYRNKTLKIYLDDLAARLPAPGGGSAACLTAAMGASLISMVINFTLGKPEYAKYEKELKNTLEKSEKLREEFLNLVDLDVAAYKTKNPRDALDIPFMTCRLCFEGIKFCPPLIKKSNINLISDIGVAVVFLESAFTAANFNVMVNLKSLDNKNLTKAVTKEVIHKEKLIKKIRKLTEEKIGKIIAG
jgi:formiminotetrahydrofolate cyclodeaminase